MFRYILVLLLVNASYRSLGNPIEPVAPGSLVNSLTALYNECGNAFLSKQIKDQTISCSNLPAPHGEKQLQCLFFYDINKQLCAAIAAGKLILPEEDYTVQINEEQNVNSLCVLAKDWVFTNLTEFIRYKQAVDKIFKHPVSCGNICGVEDFLSEDTNYFCKYYKWGSDMLKQTTTTTQNTAKDVLHPQEAVNNANVNKDESEGDNSDLQDVQVMDTSSTNAKFNTPSTKVQASPTQPKDNTEVSSLAVNQKSQSADPGTLPNVAAVPVLQAKPETSADNVGDTGLVPDNTVEDVGQHINEVAKDKPVQEPATKIKTEDTQNKPESVPKIEEAKNVQQLNNELDKAVIETPNGKAQPADDDYQGMDSEDGKEGLQDMQGGDDGDDPMIGDLPVEEQKPAQKVESVLSTYNKEPYFPNPVQGAFPEEDNEDHFFSFFLTAIVLVVLLYVLYHNKNKVGKVFFGLVVEGRAAGRRRGSRGPAYRRLDTLEQAISASAAAPPNKIIY